MDWQNESNGSNGSRAPASERRRTVLVVDDRPNALRAFRLLLTANGFDVVEATGVAQALALLDRRAIDAIIADLRLGEGQPDGAVLLDSARRWHPGIRTRLLLTSDPIGAIHADDTDSVWIDRGEDGFARRVVALLKEATS